MDLLIHIDGASRGNPGPAAAGIVIRDAATGKPIHEAGYTLGQATNNVAEYNGLLRALDIVLGMKDRAPGRVLIYSDSQLMVRHVTGEYQVKAPDLLPLFAEATAKLRRLGSGHIEHVLRGKNKRADELANMALDAGGDVVIVAVDGSAPSVAPLRGKAAPLATAAAKPARPAGAPGGLRFTATLKSSPGVKCLAHCPAKTPFAFGPATPANFCIHAAQAIFDENPTLWREAKKTEAQTECARCGVTIDVALAE